MPDPYNPWATPIFPGASAFGVGSPAETAERQPTIVDNLLSHIAGALGRGFMAPGQALQSTTPITSEQMIAPAQDMTTAISAGSAPFPGSANELRMGIKAYHGSPHDFERFDLSKIGTGEGAQAYGHGLYFAENEATAKAYRDALAGKDTLAGYNAQLKALSKEMDQYSTGEYGKYSDPRGYELKRQYDAVMDARAADKGKMYEVNINADPAHFLDWDKPLSAQSRQTQDAVRAAHEKKTGFPNVAPYYNGEEVSKLLGDKAQAAAALHEAGVPGIKYLDQGSRGSGQGSSNYVLFNDNLIDIMRKYAIPGMMAAPIFGSAIGEQKS